GSAPARLTCKKCALSHHALRPPARQLPGFYPAGADSAPAQSSELGSWRPWDFTISLLGGSTMRYRAIALSCVSVLVLGLCYAGGDERLAPQAGEKGIEAAAIRHGEYLVTEVAHCGHCHTPQNDKGLPITSRQLQGATLQIMPKKKTAEWADQSPDITRSGLAGKWSEQDMVKFLMTGVNPD